MWPFKSKISLKDSGVFNGFIDWHSHILPGVDDGIKDIEESIKVLEEYEKLGFKEVWLTPHIMEDYPNETDLLRKKFNDLKGIWNGKVEISLASENMLDSLFEERLEKNDMLPIGKKRDHLLIETSYYTAPYGMYDMMKEAKKKGYYLILAHPERYRYMEEKDYQKLKNGGILFQMNILSLVGAYGEQAKKKSEWILSKGMVDFLGTDVHRLEILQNYIEIPSKIIKNIESLKQLNNRI